MAAAANHLLAARQLILDVYTMGTGHERFVARSHELRRTYHGLLMILRQFINQDQDAADHTYRVSVHAVTIAEQLKLESGRVELVRADGRDYRPVADVHDALISDRSYCKAFAPFEAR